LLDKRIVELESRRGGLVFTLGGDKFTSQEDVKQWVLRNNIESGGIFWDLFSLLIRMGGKKQTATQQAQASYVATKANATLLELEVSSSMSFPRPLSLFVDSAGGANTLKCPSHKEWIGSGMGYSYLDRLNESVEIMVKGVRGHFRNSKGDTLVAESLLGLIERQWIRLVSFVERFHTNLIKVAKYPEESAWRLIGRCLGGFFQTMVAVRSEASMLEETTSIDNKSQMIWTVFQCHAIVEQFIAVDFRGHTSMIQQMTLYIMTERVDPTEMATQKTALAEVQKQAKELGNYKRMNGDLENAVNQLKQKVANTGKTTKST
jgi:hypothetical protein